MGVNAVDALVHFHLVPLFVRWDMVMLGLIHRAVVKKGPLQSLRFLQGFKWFCDRFPKRVLIASVEKISVWFGSGL